MDLMILTSTMNSKTEGENTRIPKSTGHITINETIFITTHEFTMIGKDMLQSYVVVT